MRMGLREANQHFSRAVRAVKAGREVILTERGHPVAVIKPLRATDATRRRRRTSGERGPTETRRSARSCPSSRVEASPDQGVVAVGDAAGGAGCPLTRAHGPDFDTSVLVKCYVTEQGTRDALSLTSRHEVLSSAIAPIEVTSILRRQVAAGGLTRHQHDRALNRFRADRTHWTLMEVDRGVLQRAESVAGMATVRTLDALHVASALVFEAETDLHPSFITGDAGQRRAAEALGLRVVFVG